jgi:hypothetical protein
MFVTFSGRLIAKALRSLSNFAQIYRVRIEKSKKGEKKNIIAANPIVLLK